jgi:Ca-activated chloride channel family protein
VLFSLSIAASRPQLTRSVEREVKARNIMLVIDISGSMRLSDFGSGFGLTSRLGAVKSVLREFIAARKYDRLGLVVFGTNAYLQVPLTRDHELLLQFIDRIQSGMAGDATAMGDGLGVALKRMSEIPSESRAIIALTDGASNAGQVSPLQAAKVAAELGIKIHTVGVGSNNPQASGLGVFFQSSSSPEYDEKTLREVASITGGVFFNASSLEGLKDVYREIDKLESSGKDEPELKLVDELFANYLTVAFVCLALGSVLSTTWLLKVP